MDVELAWLRTWLEVVDSGGFARAAARMHLSQPRVSARVASLERSLGCVLIERRMRPLTLTDDGRRLLPRARLIVTEVDDTVSDLRATAGSITGKLAIASFASGSSEFLPGILKQLRDHQPLARDRRPRRRRPDQRRVAVRPARGGRPPSAPAGTGRPRLDPPRPLARAVRRAGATRPSDPGRGRDRPRGRGGAPDDHHRRSARRSQPGLRGLVGDAVEPDRAGRGHRLPPADHAGGHGPGRARRRPDQRPCRGDGAHGRLEVRQVDSAQLYRDVGVWWPSERPLSRAAQAFVDLVLAAECPAGTRPIPAAWSYSPDEYSPSGMRRCTGQHAHD